MIIHRIIFTICLLLSSILVSAQVVGSVTETVLFPLRPASNQLAGESYDANGNQTSDLAQGIVHIKYNILNLPEVVTYSDSTKVYYLYSASGAKLREVVIPGGTGETETTDYTGNLIYKNGTLHKVLTGSGYIESGDSTSAPLGSPAYRYFLTDHLGSVRVVADAQGHVLQQNSMLPYGGDFETAEPGSYYCSYNPYKFSGKEQIRSGHYDFGARWYSPRSARWSTMDPLAEKYYSISPYAYCAGNPINLVDPNGEDIFEMDMDGRIVSRTENKDADTFYLVSKEDNNSYARILDEDGNEISISFAYGSVENIRSITFSPDKKKVDTYDIIQICGDNNGETLFEFLSQNITAKGTVDSEGRQHGIEFGLAQTGIEGDKGLNFVTTSHTDSNEYGQTYLYFGQLRNGYFIRRIVHSHPNNAVPSSPDKDLFDIMRATQTNRGWVAPIMGIYYVGSRNSSKTNTYVYY